MITTRRPWTRVGLAALLGAALVTSALVPAFGSLRSGSSGGARSVLMRAADPTRLPIGDGKVSTSPKAGYIWSCQTTFNGPGAPGTGPWVDTASGTWDSTAKVAVSGAVSWPQAVFTQILRKKTRTLTGNDLPTKYPTGSFPIAPTDPAFAYDKNPNGIAAQSIGYTLPAHPRKAARSCLPLGAIGITRDGVLLFNGLDAQGRDAGVHEVQDSCEGHPQQQSAYHRHSISSCIVASIKAKKRSKLVGYALDGFGIYVERTKKGKLLTNAALDSCHGRKSKVRWNGEKRRIYHYVATLEYPYTLGCYRGTPVS